MSRQRATGKGRTAGQARRRWRRYEAVLGPLFEALGPLAPASTPA